MLNEIKDMVIGGNEHVVAFAYSRPVAQLFQNDETLRLNVGQITIGGDTGFFSDIVSFGTSENITDIGSSITDGILSIWLDTAGFSAGVEAWNMIPGNTQITPINWAPLGGSFSPDSDIKAVFENGTLKLSLASVTDTGALLVNTCKVTASDPAPGFLVDKIYPQSMITVDGKPMTANADDGTILLFPQIVYDDSRPQIYFGLPRIAVSDIDFKCRLVSTADTINNGLSAGLAWNDMFSPYTTTAKQYSWPLKYFCDFFIPTAATKSERNLILMKKEMIAFADYLPETGRTLPSPADPYKDFPGPKTTWRFMLDASKLSIVPIRKNLVDILVQNSSTVPVNITPIYFNGDRRLSISVSRDQYAPNSPDPSEYTYEVLSAGISALGRTMRITDAPIDVDAVGIRRLDFIKGNDIFIRPYNISNIDERRLNCQTCATLVESTILASENKPTRIIIDMDGRTSAKSVAIGEGSKISVWRRADNSIIMVEIDGVCFEGCRIVEDKKDWSRPVYSINCRPADPEVSLGESLIATVITFYRRIQ